MSFKRNDFSPFIFPPEEGFPLLPRGRGSTELRRLVRDLWARLRDSYLSVWEGVWRQSSVVLEEEECGLRCGLRLSPEEEEEEVTSNSSTNPGSTRWIVLP